MNPSRKNESTGYEPYGCGALLTGEETVTSEDRSSSGEEDCGSSVEVTDELEDSMVEQTVELGTSSIRTASSSWICEGGSESTGRGSIVVRAERSFKINGLKKWLGRTTLLTTKQADPEKVLASSFRRTNSLA